MEKHCNLCNTNKSLIEFYSNKNNEDGFSGYCKKCIKEKYVYPHKERILARVKLYQKNNPDKVRETKKRDKNKPHNKVMKGISNRIKKYLKSNSLSSRDIIGCSSKELILHIEKQFSKEMTWDNRGKLWELDHIIPCAAFDSSKKEHLEWCWNYQNLRPLLKELNGNKSDYIQGKSVREFKLENKLMELNNIVGELLEKLEITTKQKFLNSFKSDNLITFVK